MTTLADIDPALLDLLRACWWACQLDGWEARPVEAGKWVVSNVLLWWK